MATINAPTLGRPTYSGDAPLAAAHGSINFAAHPIATRVRLFKLPVGSKILDFRAMFAALGAGSTIALGIEGVDSGTTFASVLLTATSTASAGNARMGNTAPIVLEEDSYIIATVGGGAVTGQFDLVMNYAPDGV